MINMLIDNYRKTLVNIADDAYTIDAKSLLYAKIVQMQLINLTGSKGLKSKSIMEYVRVLEREENTNFEKFYKDLMFLDTILDRDVNIAENYDISVELTEKLTSRLEGVIEFLGAKNLPSKSGDLKLSLSQIRELNKKGEKGKGIIDPFNVELVEAEEDTIVEEPIIEQTTIIDVEHKEDYSTGEEDKVQEPEAVLDSYVAKIVEMIDSKMQESLNQLEKTVNLSDDLIKKSVEEVNTNIKDTIDEAIKKANDSIASTVSGSIKSITDVIETKKKEMEEVKSERPSKVSKVEDNFIAIQPDRTDSLEDMEELDIAKESDISEAEVFGSGEDIFGSMESSETTFGIFNNEQMMESMD